MVCTSLLGTNTSSQQVKIWADPTSWFLVPEHMLEYQHKISKVKNVYGLYTLVLRYICGLLVNLFLEPVKMQRRGALCYKCSIYIQKICPENSENLIQIHSTFTQILVFNFLNEIRFNFIGLLWWIMFHVSISSILFTMISSISIKKGIIIFG